MSEFNYQSANDPDAVERATQNFRAFLMLPPPYPEDMIEKCLEYPPWVLYDFGSHSCRGLVVSMDFSDGEYYADVAVLRRYNRSPPLPYDRRVFGIKLDWLKPVGFEPLMLEAWATNG
jgi:hypothetical protein